MKLKLRRAHCAPPPKANRVKKDDALDEIELLRGQVINLSKELDVVEIHGGKSIDKSNYELLLLLFFLCFEEKLFLFFCVLRAITAVRA